MLIYKGVRNRPKKGSEALIMPPQLGARRISDITMPSDCAQSGSVGSLAQSVEQLAFNQLVVGSNPTRPTIWLRDLDSNQGPND